MQGYCCIPGLVGMWRHELDAASWHPPASRFSCVFPWGLMEECVHPTGTVEGRKVEISESKAKGEAVKKIKKNGQFCL